MTLKRPEKPYVPFRRQTPRAITAHLVLMTLAWLICGGPAWAEQRAVEQDPQRFFARLAEDPRFELTDEQRDTLRAISERSDAGALLARLAEDQDLDLDPDQRDLLRQIASGSTCSAPRGDCKTRRPTSMALLGAEVQQRVARGEPADPSAVDELVRRFDQADQETLDDLARWERLLRENALPESVLSRHAAFVTDYRHRATAVRDQLLGARDGDSTSLSSVAAALGGEVRELHHRPYDPERMPFRVAEPTWKEPGTSKATRPVLEPSEEPPTRRMADLPPRTLSHARLAPPSADDLEATSEVRITPEIRALAAELDHQPLRIYDWVRNHVEFYPTWGAIQDSQRTLLNRRGNAFDISSLLLALLRAADVPARYATGTIEIPAAQVRNWLGGAETPQIAQEILSIGDIASVGLLDDAGELIAIRLEHVWVEAWIDNVPSRGAVQRQGDTWLPLDAAFKQHDFLPPASVFDAVPFTAVLEGPLPFVVDEALGKITEVDTEPLDDALSLWVQQADDHLLTHRIGLTEREILGGKEVDALTSPVFAGALPYRLIERRAVYSALPDELKHSVRLRGFLSHLERADGSATFDVGLSLPELATRRLGLRFLPATPADEEVLATAKESGAASLPVYLVDVVPVVELDGEEIARGAPIGMGQLFFLDVIHQEVGRSEAVPYQVFAGDEIVIGVTGNGVSVEDVEHRFEAFPIDNAPEYLHQVGLHYWTEVDDLGEIAASRRGVHWLRLPSSGLFSSSLAVDHLLGAPHTAVYANRSMDVQRSLVGAAGVDEEQVRSWVVHAGMQSSYLEGSVFEQLEMAALGTPWLGGVSSLHLIRAATAQDLPIYRLDQANADTVLPLLDLPEPVRLDISRALTAGQIVLTSESEVDLGTWRGVGYILLDEETGAGAYLISGGKAGGGLLDCLAELEPVFRVVLQVVVVALLLAALIWLLASTPILLPATAGGMFLFFLIMMRGVDTTSAPPLPA